MGIDVGMGRRSADGGGQMSDETRNGVGIECPKCGFVHRDSFEFEAECGELECHGCGVPLEWSRHIVVTYIAGVKA